MNELYHHGIKGQKWGIRRYQNLDGTLTEEGKRRYLKNNHDINAINEVIKSLKDTDYKDFDTNNIRYSKIKYINNKPIAFAYGRQYLFEGDQMGIVLSVATNPKYRNKGYSKELAKDVILKAERDPLIKEISWAADKTNTGSINLAKSLGFDHWYDYKEDAVYIKHSIDINNTYIRKGIIFVNQILSNE